MRSLTGLLSKWPLIRQIREPADGTDFEAMLDKTCATRARIDDALGERMHDVYEAVLKSNNAPKSTRVCTRIGSKPHLKICLT
jgi:hypothetical protein